MFQDGQQYCIRWVHTPHGRSKRLETVGTGAFVLEHVATGKLWFGVSKHVSREVDRLLQLVDTQRFPNKILQTLCDSDLDLQVYEYPFRSLKSAQTFVTGLRSTVYPPYLMLN